MGGACRPGEVRLGLKTLSVLVARTFERFPDFDLAPSAGRSGTFEMLGRATRWACSSEFRHARRCGASARPFEDIIVVALYVRADGQHPQNINRKHGRSSRTSLRTLRVLKPTGHDLPGTGHADRPGLAGYSLGGGPAAPGHGQEDQGGDGGPARRFVEGAVAQGPKKAAEIFEQVNKFAGYGFNKAFARLRAGGLSDGLLKANTRSRPWPPP